MHDQCIVKFVSSAIFTDKGENIIRKLENSAREKKAGVSCRVVLLDFAVHSEMNPDGAAVFTMV